VRQIPLSVKSVAYLSHMSSGLSIAVRKDIVANGNLVGQFVFGVLIQYDVTSQRVFMPCPEID
jgi:hypothetical protein